MGFVRSWSWLGAQSLGTPAGGPGVQQACSGACSVLRSSLLLPGLFSALIDEKKLKKIYSDRKFRYCVVDYGAPPKRVKKKQ